MLIQKEIFLLFLKIWNGFHPINELPVLYFLEDMERVPYRREFHMFSTKDGSFRILFIQDMEVAENEKNV